MTEETIFNQEEKDPVNESTEGIQTPSESKDSPPRVPPELEEWVGEGKKYKSVEEVYKAFPHSQQHIENLSKKVEELEKELNSRKSAEEVLQEIQSGDTQQKPTSQGVEVNENVLSELVRNELKMFKTQEQQENNWKAVEQSFVEAYKDKADDQFRALAQENNMSVEDLISLGKKNPKLLLNVAGFDKKQTKAGPMESSFNSQAIASNSSSKEENLSAKVNPYATSRELADGWRRAGQIVQQKMKG